MPAPTYQDYMLPLLRLLADGADHQLREVRERLAQVLGLTQEDRARLLPSGRQTVFDNRVGWAKTYLDKAGLVTSARRGVYRITEVGKQVVAEEPDRVDKAYLQRFDAFKRFIAASRPTDGDLTTEPPDQDGVSIPSQPDAGTPEEQLEAAHRRIRQQVEAEVLDAVMTASPQFFEKLVIELLVKMGYGGSLADAGEALGRTGDHR